MVENTTQINHYFIKIMKNLTARNLANKLNIFFILAILISVAIIPTVYSQEEQYGWEITLNFTETDGKKEFIVFGEREDAFDSKDIYDVPDPGGPPISPYINVSFTTSFQYPHNKLLYEYKNYDIKNIYRKWNLTINWHGNINTNITINWNPNEFINSTYDSIVLYNKTGVFLSDMKLENNFTFSCSPEEIQNFEIICKKNQEPLLSSESPANNSENVGINQETIAVYILDANGDTFNWTIEGKYIENAGEINDTDGVKSANILTPLPYDTNIIWYVNVTDGEIWNNVTYNFDTKSKGGSGSNPGPIPDTPSSNIVPSAKINGPYVGFVDKSVMFYATGSIDSDGFIETYLWNFGDGTKEEGEVISHSFLEIGNYTVILTVTDDEGAKDTDITYVIITQKTNNTINKPILEGPTTGRKNISYLYTAMTTDADDDSVKYVFNWGDNTDFTTEFLSIGATVAQNHTWVFAGKYTMWVQAINDDGISSEKTFLTILIDVWLIDDEIKGHLIDDDGDGSYDSFYNPTIGLETDVELQNGDTYLIDKTGNGKWDYVFVLDTGELRIYEPTNESESISEEINNIAIVVLTIFIIILLISFVIYVKSYKNIKIDKSKK